MDRRAYNSPVSVITRDDKQPVLTGYAAVFYNPQDPGTEYEVWEGLRERIMPGAFDRALRESDPVALFNHDSNAILGRMSAKTLRLSVDGRGLKYEIDVPDTRMGQDVVTSVARGDITGSSFAFVVKEVRTTERQQDGYAIREILDVDLYDVGPVTYPAYAATTAGMRSIELDDDLVCEMMDRHDREIAGRIAAYLARARAVEIEA